MCRERTKALITGNQEQRKVIHEICDCACISFSLHQSGYKPRQKPQLPLLEFRVSLQNIGFYTQGAECNVANRH